MPFLEMKNIVKTYPGVQALKGVNLAVEAGEVHALVGENGAGKSTLMKILAGAEPMDSGKLFVDGQEIQLSGPSDAQKKGISMIYQEFNLVPEMTVAENIFLGREPVKSKVGLIDWKTLRMQAAQLLERLDAHINVQARVSELSIAQQQMVEIAKALSYKARLIVMDEPSATLTEHELAHLFKLIKDLSQTGMAVIYISHRLEEIFEICNRVTILRDGEWITTRPISEISREEIVRLMVGRELGEEFPKVPASTGRILLRVTHLSSGNRLKNASFEIRSGEIVGLAGLVGSGRTELARAILGLGPKTSGRLELEGKPLTIHSPMDAIKAGIALIPEDRKGQGLVMGASVRENVTLASLKKFSRSGFILSKKEMRAVQKMVNDLRIKTPSINQPVQFLSGGNQQKVVLAKGLLTESKILIFDEPTRGIDVGAKQEIYHLMNDLVKSGMGILMISSELPEILGMSDRILVMHEGKLVGDVTRADATQEKVMALAMGMV
ncbi:MAG: sugar ABC transporter ATP-binding protein [Calditrichaeota bacterium]|nr:sugar ABC transporter ATP-binding protein [Calditrichota bacterium]